MKRILLTLIIGMFLISSVSAFDFDNVKSYEKAREEITITNAFGLGEDLATYKLTKNTDSCLVNCFAEGEATFYTEGYLFTDLRFEDKRGRNTNIQSSNILLQVNRTYQTDIIEYGKEVCNPHINGSLICTTPETGSHIEETGKLEWEEYQGQVLPSGNYVWRVEGRKDSTQSIDWIGSAFGEEFTEWSWWDPPSAFCKDLGPSSADLRINEPVNVNITVGTDWAFVTTLYTGVAQNYSVYYNTIEDIRIVNETCKEDGEEQDFEVIDTTAELQFNTTIFEYYDFGFEKSEGDSITLDGYWLVNFGTWEYAATQRRLHGRDADVTNTPTDDMLNDSTDSARVLSLSWFDDGEMDLLGVDLFLFGEQTNNNHLGKRVSTGIDNYTKRIDGDYSNTSIPITVGWHTFKIVANASGSSLFIDNINVGTDASTSFIRTQMATNNLDVLWDSYAVTTGQDIQQYVDYTNFTLGAQQEPSDLSIVVTLESPENAVQFNTFPQSFTSNFSAANGNVTNTTLVVWNADGSEFGRNSTLGLEGITNRTNSSLLLASGSNQEWNYLACVINSSSDSVCSWGITNRTFDVIPFEINSQSFDNFVFETSSQKFGIDIDTSASILSVQANLHYNGTVNNAQVACSTGNCIINSTIDIPLISQANSENKSLFWEINVFDGTSSSAFNTSALEQNVSRVFLEQCNATHTTETLNFTVYDEQNLSKFNHFKFDGTFDFWLGSGSFMRNNSFSKNITEMLVCLSPNQTLNIDALIDYDEGTNTTLYTNRFYHFDDEPINNVSQDVFMYLLKSASSTSFILKVQDENLLPVRDALIEIHRFYPGEGIFRIVQIAKTDDNGKSIGFFVTETVDYKFIIKKAGVTLLETGQQKVIPESSPFTLTFNTGTDLGEPWSTQNAIADLDSTLAFDKTTGIVTYTYVDTSGDFTQARLLVQEESLVNISAYRVICNDTVLISAASITCNVGNSSGFYIASSFITRTAEGLDLQISFQIETFSSVAGLLGLFFGWFLILIASFMFKFNEVAGIWSITITILLVNIIGLIKFGGLFVSAILGVAVVLTWVMEK